MVSMSTAKCNSPRPETMNLSGESPSATRRATLYCSSRSRRSRMLRLVMNFPSRPAKGDVLTWKVMEIVGSSTLSAGSASAASGSQIVSDMDNPSMPDTLTMSPANASSCSTRWRPEKPMTCSTFARRVSPSRSTTATGIPRCTRPRLIRPSPIRPT